TIFLPALRSPFPPIPQASVAKGGQYATVGSRKKWRAHLDPACDWPWPLFSQHQLPIRFWLLDCSLPYRAQSYRTLNHMPGLPPPIGLVNVWKVRLFPSHRNLSFPLTHHSMSGSRQPCPSRSENRPKSVFEFPYIL